MTPTRSPGSSAARGAARTDGSRRVPGEQKSLQGSGLSRSDVAHDRKSNLFTERIVQES